MDTRMRKMDVPIFNSLRASGGDYREGRERGKREREGEGGLMRE